MVARIKPTRNTASLLLYNEKKVAQKKARLIAAGNFIQDKENLTYAEKLYRFQHQNELNSRSRVKMLHATINFHPSEKLSDETLSAIADRYMTGLQMQDQPYLVYRHEDADHPHIHIVSSLIRPDGSRINTDHMAIRLSEPTRKEIEKEFHLQPSQKRKKPPIQTYNEASKFLRNNGVSVSESIDNIVKNVRREYSFGSLHEYNAILRTYNILAETGSPKSKTRRHHGIYYIGLDDAGNKITPPVMAKDLPSRPTLSALNKDFSKAATKRPDMIIALQQRIEWQLDQQPRSIGELTYSLQKEGIEIVRPPVNGRYTYDQIYVDHLNKTAIGSESLGQRYTVKGITNSIREQVQHTQKQARKAPQKTRLNANVPQTLSASIPLEHGHQAAHSPQRQMHITGLKHM